MKNKLFPILIISTSILFVLRLFWVQLININDVQLSNKNSVQRIYNYPERGYIFDRNNNLLVENEPYYDLMIIPKDLKEIELIDLEKFTKAMKRKKPNNIPQYLLCVPIFSPQKGLQGYLILSRNDPFRENENELLRHLSRTLINTLIH